MGAYDPSWNHYGGLGLKKKSSQKIFESESDVEQKFVFQLLTNPAPDGLGIPSVDIQTKVNIRKFAIEKRAQKKIYYPDYILLAEGIPLAIVEAKPASDRDLSEAFREARLYAAELNAMYAPGVAPVSFVIASNGVELWAGPADYQDPELVTTVESLKPYSPNLEWLSDHVGAKALAASASKVQSALAPQKSWKPRSLVGGQSVQDEPMGLNTFGATISSDLKQMFTPSTREERAKIVREAYITSSRRTRYVQPIDAIIRAASPFNHGVAQLIEDTGRPSPVVEKIRGSRTSLEHKVMLLVGGAGAGKTTFVDYLQEVALPADLRESTLWVHLNMNYALVNREEIYNWLREEIIDSIRSSFDDIDFDELETAKALYSVEINAWNKQASRLLGEGSSQYNTELYNELKGLKADRHRSAQAYCRHCGGERGKLVIIVLDNCDKRLLEEQLLMFEAAQWLQREFRALIILPLREETYDNHSDAPPLDTALKDMVFRIEAPPFHNVLSKRVEMALNQLHSSEKTYRYELKNGMHVNYDAGDQAKYLSAIVASIFAEDRTVSRLVLGLAGGNLRRAFEIFLEFCNSGHIPESEILKIQRATGTYQIPLYIMLRVLLRQNRRYYDGSKTYLRNLFSTKEAASPRDYFLYLSILEWLRQRSNQRSISRIVGYFPIREIVDFLAVYGFRRDVVTDAITSLARWHCVLTEDFKVDHLKEATLVKISPAGIVHLELLSGVDYWAAVAEDIYFDDYALAERIAGRMANAATHYNAVTGWQNAAEAHEYLEAKLLQAVQSAAFVHTNDFADLVNLSAARTGIAVTAEQIGMHEWSTAKTDYPTGTVIECKIARIKPFGFFCGFQ
ncbi:type I restriction endonuclease [Brucella sp. NM4]|uniref:type I restriction endonuclease n=1 Tax=Brucella/Ochrobactrum group TaxID=2826938 RepID=UPI0024BCEA01|nr:type I restriction endonuclease [Brucella sp. NM4]WHS33586.1 type I restriction endonuclease [Brucella sp. NM4]WHT43686.1 type I restriction endonuclease [Ochrobactrum sp. SSR]